MTAINELHQSTDIGIQADDTSSTSLSHPISNTALPRNPRNPPAEDDDPPPYSDICVCGEDEKHHEPAGGPNGSEAGNSSGFTHGSMAGAAGAVVGTAAAPAAASGILGVVGFGAQGVVAGSWAAAMQASIGNVAAGSAFALAQSIGAGAALPVLGFVVGAASGGLAAVGLGYAAYKVCTAASQSDEAVPVICPRCGKPKSS